MSTQGATYGLIAKAMGIPEDDDEIGLSMQISEKILPNQQEDHAKSREIIADLENNLIGAINKLFRVGCLCTNHKKSLMWSHYADSHRGFCVEYDFAEADIAILPFPVVYSNIRPQVPWGEALTRSPENTAMVNVPPCYDIVQLADRTFIVTGFLLIATGSFEPLV